MNKIEEFRTIDFESPVPFYIQIRDTIRIAIEQDQFKPGECIPGENDLCEYFGVSRTVVRQALDELVHEGLIVRKKGKGTFVCEPKILERFGQEITSFYQAMSSMQYQIKTKVLRNEIGSADKETAKHLSINIGDPIIFIKRVRYLKDEPILVVSSYYPFDKCQELLKVDLSKKSLYEFFETSMGYTLKGGKRSIEAALADSEQAHLLDIQVGAPLLLINSVVYLDVGTPIEFYRSHYRGDRYKFDVELIRMKEGVPSNQMIDEEKKLPSSEGILKN